MKPNRIALFLLFLICLAACQQHPTPIPYMKNPTQPLHNGMPTSLNSTQTFFDSTPTPLIPSPTTLLAPLSTETITRTPFPTVTFSSPPTAIPTLQAGETFPTTLLHMKDESNGWGLDANGHLLHTRDGAATWHDATPPSGAYDSNGFFALNGLTAWASPHCTTYEEVDPGYGTFTMAGCGRLSDYTSRQNSAIVWSTHDGGNTWTASQPLCVDDGCGDISSSGQYFISPKSIRFLDDRIGWFVVSNGYRMFQDRYAAYSTNDGGQTWDFVTSSLIGKLSYYVTSFEPLTSQSIFMFSYEIGGATDPTSDFEYRVSKNGGNAWSDLIHVSPRTIPLDPSGCQEIWCGTNSSHVIPPLVIDVVLECRYFNLEPREMIWKNIHFHSVDGGKTWNDWLQSGDVFFLNAETGWQVFTQNDGSHEIQQTTDGGHTWVKLASIDWDGALTFVDETTGWALNQQGGSVRILQTTDGGRTWHSVAQGLVTPTPTP